MSVSQTLIFIFTLLAGGAFAVFLIWFLLDYLSEKRRVRKALDLRLFRISVPKAQASNEMRGQESQQNQREIISVIEQFLASVSSIARESKSALKNVDHIVFEIAALHEEIVFYMAVPQAIADLVEKQLHAVYTQVVVEPSEEYNIFLPQIGYAHAAYLKQKKDFVWPIRTYQQIESDPLSVLTNALSKLTKEEGAIIQILLRPAKNGWQKKSEGLIKDLQEQKITLAGKSFASSFKDILKSDSQKSQSAPENYKPLSPVVEEAVRAIGTKNSKVGFETNVRIVASSPQATLAKQHVRDIIAAFRQFDFPQLNALEPVVPRQSEQQAGLIQALTFRSFSKKQSMLLSSDEVGSFMHLPDSRLVETPSIAWLGARTAPAPARLPEEGRLIGDNVYRGQRRSIYLPRNERRKHFYIVGKTGTGKTTLLVNMIRQDIEAGEGVAYLDPHGDAIEQILQTIPKERADDVIVFRPGDVERPVGLNMLEYDSDEFKDFVVGEMIAIFSKLFPPEIVGPMFEHNMRNVMLTLMEDKDNPGTLAEIPRMFSDERYQRYKISKVKDPVVRSFWKDEMAKTSDFHKSEMLGYLISKVGRFVENRMMRNIIGQSRSGFNFRDIMDNKKIFLANLSKGEMGDDNSNLIGMILVTKIQMAALSRANIPEDDRKDFYLYLDEFQNFTTDSIPTVLSEARKYRLNLILAHQFITQVDEEIRDAIFGNVGSILSYRVGAKDAEILEKEFEPVFIANDIVNLSFAQAYYKTASKKAALPAFSVQIPAPLEITDPERVNPKVAEALKQLVRLKYGRDRTVVEQEISSRGRIPATL